MRIASSPRVCGGGFVAYFAPLCLTKLIDLPWNTSTVAQARQACCRVLVQEHTDRICESVEAFLTNNQTTDLHRVFSLFSELPKEDALVSLKVRNRVVFSPFRETLVD
jgi:hypothetical protein